MWRTDPADPDALWLLQNASTSKRKIKGPRLRSTAEGAQNQRQMLRRQGMRNRRKDPWRVDGEQVKVPRHPRLTP